MGVQHDRIVGGAARPLHPHRDIESLTWVVAGVFDHDDSLGGTGRLGPGGAQAMTFSHVGAEHSEHNGARDDELRFLQFWILPSRTGLATGLQQAQHDRADRTGGWQTIMSPAGEEGLDLHQDARVLVSHLAPGDVAAHDVADGRGADLYVVDGGVTVDGDRLRSHDALVVGSAESLALAATADSELILVDVPMAFTPVGVWAGR